MTTASTQTTRSSIAKAAASKDKPERPVEVRSDKVPGLLLRIQPTGARNYYAQVARGKRIRLGSAAVLTLKQAEDRARAVLLDPDAALQALEAKRAPAGVTLEEYLDETYAPEIRTLRRSAEDTIQRIKAAFPTLLSTRLEDITAEDVKAIRLKRRAAGKVAATVNRDVAALSGLFSHWSERTKGKGARHILHDLDPLEQPKDKRQRYLSADEEQRLRAALAARDAEGIAARERFNKWRRERGQPTFPEIVGPYSDHLTPMALLSLNTGMRQGEVFGLTWEAVNFEKWQVTVRAHTSKSNKTRVIPLNAEARAVLLTIKPPIAKGLVFPSPVSGEQLTSIKTAWAGVIEAAKIEDFRWHDLRHTFASKLVNKGRSLYEVQQLLGHGSLSVTERYAHLRDEQLADAVSQLDD